MFQLLQWACVAIFTVSVPLVVFARYRYPEFPAWHFILLTAVLGWVLANAHAGIQHLWVDAEATRSWRPLTSSSATHRLR